MTTDDAKGSGAHSSHAVPQHRATLPNALIAGVNKAGTTTLFTRLTGHPDVCGSTIKETCYFLPKATGQSLPPLEQYTNRFRHHKTESVVLEATPGYFYGGVPLIDAICATLGTPKIIIVFRDPVDRFFSFFKAQQTALQLPVDLMVSTYIKECQRRRSELSLRANHEYFGLRGGEYADFLPSWVNAFRSTLRILFFDDLVERPNELLSGLSSWLDIDPGPLDDPNQFVENQTAGFRFSGLQRVALTVNRKLEPSLRRYPGVKRTLRSAYRRVNGRSDPLHVSRELRDSLVEYYRPYNTRLGAQLQSLGVKNLPPWLLSSSHAYEIGNT